MLQHDVLRLAGALYLFFSELLIEQLADLETDLCILVRIERCDS